MGIVSDEIKALKPTCFGAAEVRNIGGRFYVYPFTSKYDKITKKRHKVTLRCVGKITLKDGFIPNKEGKTQMAKLKMLPKLPCIVKSYGAYEMLEQLSSDLSDELKKFFPDCFREIRSFALLRLVEQATPKQIHLLFEQSGLSDECADIATSEASVRKFILKLGTLEPQMQTFMRSQMPKDGTVMFDGTSFFTRMDDSLSAKGYNPKRSLNPQVRLLYVFGTPVHKPLFYRVLQGSVVDKTAFIDTFKASGCTDCIVLADKGFYSKPNISVLQNSGLNIKFIFPLQSNTKLVPASFYENLDNSKFDGVFTFNKRTIFFKKFKVGNDGNFVYTYLDESRRCDDMTHFVEKAENNYDEEQFSPMDVTKQHQQGYFSFISNLDISPKEIYLKYKQRWDIEECFDYLKNAVSTNPMYAHNNEYLSGLAFLNHISLLYYFGLINALNQSEYHNDFTPSDLIKMTRNIEKVTYDDQTMVCQIPKKIQEVLTAIGVDVLRKI